MPRWDLQARHDFVQRYTTLDPVDQKTLAQFTLLGDPSIHAVEPVAPTILAPMKRVKSVSAEKLLLGRADRRHHLLTTGLSLANLVRVAVQSAKRKPTGSVKRVLDELARKTKVPAKDVLSFSIRNPAGSLLGKALAVGLAQATAYYVMSRDVTTKKCPTKRLVVLVAKEENGKIVSYEEYHSR